MGKSLPGKSSPIPSPIGALRGVLGLTQQEFAERVGLSRGTLADAEHMRREKPPMALFKRLQRQGLIQNVALFAHQYRVARAGCGSEWLSDGGKVAATGSEVAVPALAPSNPLQQFLDLNGINFDDLCKRLGGGHRSIMNAILTRQATVKAAATFLQTLRWAFPMEWAAAHLHDGAEDQYQASVVFFKDRDETGWRNFMECSQPKEAAE